MKLACLAKKADHQEKLEFAMTIARPRDMRRSDSIGWEQLGGTTSLGFRKLRKWKEFFTSSVSLVKIQVSSM